MTQQSATWIHRWSRPLMAAIATLGAVITGYLTVIKLSGGSTACPTHGCDIVLSSPYATVLGLPLALFGCLAYLSMAVLAIAPLLIPASRSDSLRSQVEQWTGLLLFLGGTAMLVFSGYLMYLLAFQIQAVCLYCIASAVLSASLFGLAVFNHNWQDAEPLLLTGAIVAVVVLAGTVNVYAQISDSVAVAPAATPTVTAPVGQVGEPITTTSGEAEIALADHLSQIGAKMYGAWWCPHCHEQKQLFGQEAFSRVDYVECDPEGQDPHPEVCQAVGVEAYPTWFINEQKLSGTQSLKDLADLSGYQGSRDFIN